MSGAQHPIIYMVFSLGGQLPVYACGADVLGRPAAKYSLRTRRGRSDLLLRLADSHQTGMSPRGVSQFRHVEGRRVV